MTNDTSPPDQIPNDDSPVHKSVESKTADSKLASNGSNNRPLFVKTDTRAYPPSLMPAAVQSRYQDALTRPLDVSDEAQVFARRSPRRYDIPEYKRHHGRSNKAGWQQLSDVAMQSQHQLGSLFRRIDRMAKVEAIVLDRLGIPAHEKVRAVMNSKRCLTLMVRSAPIAHRLRFSLYAVKAEIEQALGETIPKLEIKVKPDLI